MDVSGWVGRWMDPTEPDRLEVSQYLWLNVEHATVVLKVADNIRLSVKPIQAHTQI